MEVGVPAAYDHCLPFVQRSGDVLATEVASWHGAPAATCVATTGGADTPARRTLATRAGSVELECH
jgi:hypothetical protein